MKSGQNRWKIKIHIRGSVAAGSATGAKRAKFRINYRHQKQTIKQRNQTRRSNKSTFNHPDFKQKCFLTKSMKSGRTVHTAEPLQVGEVALVSRAYVAVVQAFIASYCLTCHKTQANFIRCEECKTVFFCSKRCKEENLSHQFECGTQFHQTNCTLLVKAAIKIVLESMATFQYFKDLQNFVEQSINDIDDIPKGSNTRESKLDCILKLKKHESVGRFEHDQISAYKLITTFPKVQQYFELEDEGNNSHDFLQHFLWHNVLAIAANAFGTTMHTKEGVFRCTLLFDILSYINHSCSPNLLGLVQKNEITLITCQRILPGEQFFISYVKLSKESKEQRQNKLSNWNFDCHCVRCDYGRDISFDEFQRANQLSRKELEHILNKPSKWTPQKGACIYSYYNLLE